MRLRKDAPGVRMFSTGLARYERLVSGSAGSGVVSRLNALSSPAKGSNTCDDFLRIDLGGGGGGDEKERDMDE